MKLVESKVKLPYDEMDKEMIEICEYLNTLPGVETRFCCSGHGVLPVRRNGKRIKAGRKTYISFACDNKEVLARLIFVTEQYGEDFLTKSLDWDIESLLELDIPSLVFNGETICYGIRYCIRARRSFSKDEYIDKINTLLKDIKEIMKDEYDYMFKIK